jgi:hypothetical protein
MAHGIGGVRRRRARRTADVRLVGPALPVIAAAVPAEPVKRAAEPAEPSFVCVTCRRDMVLSERSRISPSKCRACV